MKIFSNGLINYLVKISLNNFWDFCLHILKLYKTSQENFVYSCVQFFFNLWHFPQLGHAFFIVSHLSCFDFAQYKRLSSFILGERHQLYQQSLRSSDVTLDCARVIMIERFYAAMPSLI